VLKYLINKRGVIMTIAINRVLKGLTNVINKAANSGRVFWGACRGPTVFGEKVFGSDRSGYFCHGGRLQDWEKQIQTAKVDELGRLIIRVTGRLYVGPPTLAAGYARNKTLFARGDAVICNIETDEMPKIDQIYHTSYLTGTAFVSSIHKVNPEWAHRVSMIQRVALGMKAVSESINC
jgi:hypothetical protein